MIQRCALLLAGAAHGAAEAAPRWSPGLTLEYVPVRTELVSFDSVGGAGAADHRLMGGVGVELERLSDGGVRPLFSLDLLAERVSWEAGAVTDETFSATLMEPRALVGLRLPLLEGRIHPYGDVQLGGALVLDHTGPFDWDSAIGPVGLLALGVEGGDGLRWRAALRGSYTLVTQSRAIAVDGVDYGYTVTVSPANATVGVLAGLSF